MKVESISSVLWHLARTVLLIDLGVFMITALICWLAGWHTVTQYGNGLMIGGLALLLLGGVTGFGGNQIAHNPTYRYIQSVMPNRLDERSRQTWIDYLDSMRFLIFMGLAGLVSIGTGWLLTELVG
jgi:uncharacterized membrane protein YfcA